jgi:histidine triad (HIT) family protein
LALMSSTTHEPPGYSCPFCQLVSGVETARNSQRDVVCRTPGAIAFISPRWWPNNQGHVLAVPLGHYENLYTLPREAGHAVHDLVREVAIAIRSTYGCDGVSTRQHNEPAGNQDAWHYHVHVFPRYEGDDLYATSPNPQYVDASRRRPYADRLRGYFDSHPAQLD